MNFNNLICEKLSYLKARNVAASAFEIKLLLADVLGIEIGSLAFYKNELSDEQVKKFDEYIEKRALHYPADKIIGSKGFYKYDFFVNEKVLSPRADSECLVESAIKLSENKSDMKILEFGVGSGCLIVSILAEMKNAKGTGFDISSDALQITKHNAEKIGVDDKLKLICGSWFDEDVIKQLDCDFDLIISNPPYIPSGDITSLDIEVKNFDPLIALDGGEDGLRDYRQICKIAHNKLKKNGFLIFEAGINQAEDICKIARENNFQPIETVKDLTGIDRCIILKK